MEQNNLSHDLSRALVDLNDYFSANQSKKDLNEKLNYLGKFLFKMSFQSNVKQESFDLILQKCTNNNQKFLDNQFPHSKSSLIINNKKNENSKWGKIKWLRPIEYMQNFTIFPEELSPREIFQGALNNNTFLSVMTALLENPIYIKSLFLTDKINDYGVYGVYLNKDRKYLQYIIDDYFPCDNRKNIDCFSHGKENTIWLQILEKCYAKACGSYSNLENKNIDSILHDLIPAPIETLDNFSQNLYLNLRNAKDRNWLILASADETESCQSLIREIGLIPKYTYVINNLFVIDEDIVDFEDSNDEESDRERRDENILLQMKNYKNNDGWLGDWSEGNIKWTEAMKNKVDYTNNNSTNSFYMNLKDFKHYFSKIRICKICKGYKYEYIPLIQKVNSYSLVKMSFKLKNNNNNSDFGNDNFNDFITLSQIKNKKAFPKLNFGVLRMVIAKLINYDENTHQYEVEYIIGEMGENSDIVIEYNFEEGDYLIYTELGENIFDTEIVLSTYTNCEVKLEKLNEENYPNILEHIYISCAKIQNNIYSFSADNAPNCRKYSNRTPEGFLYIYIENDENGTIFVENVNYTTFEGLELLKPFSGTSYNVEVESGSSQIILIKQLKNDYKIEYSYHNNFIYTEERLKELTLTKGRKTQRKEYRLNVDLNINVFTFKHSNGICFYYENMVSDKKLEETLKFSSMNGVKIAGHSEMPEDEIFVEVGPMETLFVQLVATKQEWTVKISSSYTIKPVES